MKRLQNPVKTHHFNLKKEVYFLMTRGFFGNPNKVSLAKMAAIK
jgi:hypothetical protein